MWVKIKQKILQNGSAKQIIISFNFIIIKILTYVILRFINFIN